MAIVPRPKAIALLLILSILGCGGSAGPISEVLDVRSDRSVLRVGERTGIEVEFSVETEQDFDIDPSDDDEPGYSSLASEVGVVVPAGLRFVEGSSSLNDNFFGDNIFGDEDPRGPNRFIPCPDGSTALLYSFSRNELDPDNPLAKRIRFETDAVAANGLVTIRAASASTLSRLCDLSAEGSATVELLP